MSLIVPIAEWLQWKAKVPCSIPSGSIYFILNFSLTSGCSQLGEAYANESKHGINPDWWVQRHIFNIKKNYVGGLYDDGSALR